VIQLAFALEISSKTLAIESLARASCSFHPDFLRCHATDAAHGEPREEIDSILASIGEDKRFSNANYENTGDLLTKLGGELAVYAWRWDIDRNLEAEFINVQMKAVALATSRESYATAFESVVKSANALRLLLPMQREASVQLCLVRQWLLLFLASYVYAGKPTIPSMKDEATQQLSWTKVSEHAVDTSTPCSNSLGVVRSLKCIGEAWNEWDSFCLQAAARYLRFSAAK
jgi:hypothetical protein